MKLKEYLNKNRMHPIELAAKSGVSIATIYKCLYAVDYQPRIATCQLIELATDNHVTRDDLRTKKNKTK